ncbi:hypothetical protein DRB96_42250 [Streptomyces sp. ICC1]|nr:hypothetical protein DRB96_42250 [Streptomyces sp. ICC1]
MHYPSDVAGGLLNGAATLLITGCALLYGRGSGPEPDRAARPGPAPASRTGGPVLVVRHPHGCPDELADRLAAVLRGHGHRDPRWILTTAERPCGALAEEISTVTPALVVVCGGDGTVRACADVLAGTRIPLAVAPCGTGNLLARNLGLPMDPAVALEASLAGDSFGIDVGRVRGDGLPPTRFTVMAGAGFDAAMVRDASPRLKSRMGWAAYVLSALRHLRDPGVRLTVRIDGGRRQRRRARMVVIGNVGTLQGGLPLLPSARPDSGRLEVVLFDPRGAPGWLAAAGYLAARLLRHRTPTGVGGAGPGAVRPAGDRLRVPGEAGRGADADEEEGGQEEGPEGSAAPEARTAAVRHGSPPPPGRPLVRVHRGAPPRNLPALRAAPQYIRFPLPGQLFSGEGAPVSGRRATASSRSEWT